MMKHRQHYVWRHYLAAWAEGGRLHCDHEGKRFPASPDNVAHQRDFYRLHEISSTDLSYIAKIAEGLPQPTPALAQQWISLFQTPFDLRRRYEAGQARDDEVEAALNTLRNDLEEEIHSRFERKAIPLLAALKRLDPSLLFDDVAGIDAAMFLGLQYLRTPRMVSRISGLSTRGLLNFNIAAAGGLLRCIYATAFARAILVRQSAMLVSFLLAAPERNFITGDQPIVNTLALNSEGSSTQVELYYPLSPTIALLLSFNSSCPTTRQVQLSLAQTQAYNQMIAETRERQLYATSVTDFGPLIPPPVGL
jgi:hypothetical protein